MAQGRNYTTDIISRYDSCIISTQLLQNASWTFELYQRTELKLLLCRLIL